MNGTCPLSIAVVGLSGVFPGAADCDQFWHNICQKVDTTRAVSENRWGVPLRGVCSDTWEVDKAYCRNACWVDQFHFNSSGFNIDKALLLDIDPMCQWVLQASQRALSSTKIESIDKQRTGVILAAIALPTEMSSFISRDMMGLQLIQENLDHYSANPMPTALALSGRVVGLPAAIVSQGLGLGGSNYTLDAACASSLYAVKLACEELRSHRADAMITGGVSRPDSLYTQIGFSQLRALSPTGRCAPFDQSADGLVVGEGAGIMVLKRLDDAIAHGDTIHGIIRGIGLSNDMRGNLLAPESGGQIRAMQAAYAEAGWSPHDVDYIECHGAGTPVGDAAELQSLQQLWGDKGWQNGQCAIGSVKSMIGHLLTGAGAAGMIKTLLALTHKTLPPSLKYTNPKPGSPLIDGPFRVETDGRRWPEKTDGAPRKAAVSAFGFGGINAHVLIEEWQNQKTADCSHTSAIRIRHPSTRSTTPAKIAIVGMNLHFGSVDSVKSFQTSVFNGRSNLTRVPSQRWKAAQYADLYFNAGFKANFMKNVAVAVGEFQIPPDEIPGILPQQLLMLKVAAGAMIDAGLPLRQARERMGTIIGIGFDYEATNFHLRWALPSMIDKWKDEGLFPKNADISNQWLEETKDQFSPPLTATRTLGALGGIVASRIAREFRFGGPSFVVSAEEASGLQAMEIASRMLQSGEMDAALVGAVDLNGDERNIAGLYSRLGLSVGGEVRPFDVDADGTLPGEGAVALVLKRLEDAETDRDRVYGIIEGIGAASGKVTEQNWPDETVYLTSLNNALQDARTEPGQIDLMECHASGIPSQDDIETAALHQFFGTATPPDAGKQIAVGTLKPIIGHTGATSGLASLAKTALCLYHQIIAPVSHFEKPARTQWWDGLFHFPTKPVYWPRNRIDGPRKACVAAMTSDGHCMHAVLGQAENPAPPEVGLSIRPMRPLGPLPHGLFIIAGKDQPQLLGGLNGLDKMSMGYNSTAFAMESLAHQWHQKSSSVAPSRNGPLRYLAIVAETHKELHALIADAKQTVELDQSVQMMGRGGIAYDPSSIAHKGDIAFVYPGSGNHYVGMGRTLGAHWPEVLREMEAQTDLFKSQLLPQWCDPWRVEWSKQWQRDAYAKLVADPLHTIFAQVMFGGQLTGLLKKFNIHPDAMLGYSLGESAGLFALGAWPDRGQMLERLERSDLFTSQLSGSLDAVRQAWDIPEDQSIEWKVAAVNRDAQTVDRTISDLPFVRRLIVNTPDQCVIGGLASQVRIALRQMDCTAVFLDGVVAVHCDAAQPVADAYRQLHMFDTTCLPKVRYYSCAYEKALDLTAQAAAASIVRQATEGFDFSRVVEKIYADGVRTFLEVGPHCSCTGMIDQILGEKPHLAVAANHRGEFEPLSLLKCLGTLAASGVAIDLHPLYGYPEDHFSSCVVKKSTAAIKVPVGGTPLTMTLPAPSSGTQLNGPGKVDLPDMEAAPEKGAMHEAVENAAAYTLPSELGAMIHRLNGNVTATAKVHGMFLKLSQELTTQYGNTYTYWNELLASLKSDGTHPAFPGYPGHKGQPNPTRNLLQPVAFTRSQCMEFAVGSVGKMLGPEFNIIDTYKARVRLPDDPLMLVDRILSVEGEKLSLGPGRVITEHDVLPDAWYLDGNRAPVCISVEAGQADLFLCAYLGIDHRVKGERTYRLLDAKICFHRGLPQPGETIRYDICIDKFVRQEETYLFFFRFEGYIGDTHLITMTDGCAGFFTDEEVRNSGGIILTESDRSGHVAMDGLPYSPLVDLCAESYDEAQIDALRRGDAAACLGSQFSGIQLPGALCLPKGQMRLVHRVVDLDPVGGRFGKGYVKAEADIRPDDWFLTCHFVDDMVMPGTLMYECCAHSLRVLLLRMGWVTDKQDVCFEPVQKVTCRLKCRGPVTPGTRHVQYIVEIKEMGYHPEPYVIADAHMYADGHYIVFFKDMSMQMTHTTHQDIQRFWQTVAIREKTASTVVDPAHPDPLFTRDHILEFAVGRPSKAFGQPYAVFDRDRTIARLPGPPYCFMDRVTSIEPAPWIPQPGGWVEAQYDVPEDAWYFAADASGIMPLCVLLEIALQPCGWLAAYAGSALKSDNDLKFRNLGGKAVLHANPAPSFGTLTMRSRITKVSDAADMIIEHFDFEVYSGARTIYTGTTYFGFFSAKALAQQVGLRETVFKPSEKEMAHIINHAFADLAPLVPDEVQADKRFKPKGMLMPGKALRMVDGVEIYCPDGGPHGLGYVKGYKTIDPQEWFFKAHFFQDPVCPGSLGIESFLQLIKFAAMERWPHLVKTHRFELIVSREHQWTYRGQVIPGNQKVYVEAIVTQVVEADTLLIMADGCLQVDGIYIYKMEGFGLRLVPL
jgi:PfaB family protein